jgi:hypothetical protein
LVSTYEVYDPLVTACAATCCSGPSAHHAAAGYATTRTVAQAVTYAIITIGTGYISIPVITHTTTATCASIRTLYYIRRTQTCIIRFDRHYHTDYSNHKQYYRHYRDTNS